MFYTSRDFENVVIEAIGAWLENPNNINRWVTAQILHDESRPLSQHKPYLWPESIMTFGRRMMYRTLDLEGLYGMKKRISHGCNQYMFTKKIG